MRPSRSRCGVNGGGFGPVIEDWCHGEGGAIVYGGAGSGGCLAARRTGGGNGPQPAPGVDQHTLSVVAHIAPQA